MADIENGIIPPGAYEIQEGEIDHVDIEAQEDADFEESSPFYVKLPFILAGVVAVIACICVIGGCRGWFTKDPASPQMMQEQHYDQPAMSGEQEQFSAQADEPSRFDLDGKLIPGVSNKITYGVAALAATVGGYALMNGGLPGMTSQSTETGGTFSYSRADQDRRDAGNKQNPSLAFLQREGMNLGKDTTTYVKNKTSDVWEATKDMGTDYLNLANDKPMVSGWRTAKTTAGWAGGLYGTFYFWDQIYYFGTSCWRWINPMGWARWFNSWFQYLVLRRTLNSDVNKFTTKEIDTKIKNLLADIRKTENTDEIKRLIEKIIDLKRQKPANIHWSLWLFSAYFTLMGLAQFGIHFLPGWLSWIVSYTSPQALTGYCTNVWAWF